MVINCREVFSFKFIGKDAKSATEKVRRALGNIDNDLTRSYIKPSNTDLLFGQEEIEFDFGKCLKLKAGDFDKIMMDVVSAKAVSEFNINQSTTSGRSI